MKAVILAGGLGTRLSEETSFKPKPMVDIGGKPIIWHIMKIYSHYGINDFIICCGYKGYAIKEYFHNYFLHSSDVTIDMRHNSVAIHHKRAEPWTISLVDTGEHTMTGGRLKRVREYLDPEDDFCFTYGDGVADVDIQNLLDFHKKHQRLATMTAVYAPGRFGAIEMSNNQVTNFKEKPIGDGAMINGGFFILSPKVIDLIDDDTTTWEQEPLEKLAERKQLMAYRHQSFWHPMDTLKDKNYLERLWQNNEAPWRVWI